MLLDFEKIKSLKDLKKHKKKYLEFKKNNSRLCENCKILEKLNLPYDCLSKPNYCLKTFEEINFIITYEETEDRIKNYG